MSESSLATESRAHRYWRFIVEGWPVIAAALGLSWAIAISLGDKFVTDIIDREISAQINLEEDPTIQGIRTELVAINGKLETQEGNDEEIRTQLGTVIQRLDQVIQIQLQAASRGGNQ